MTAPTTPSRFHGSFKRCNMLEHRGVGELGKTYGEHQLAKRWDRLEDHYSRLMA
jgi:hypothetical protein